SGAIAMARLTFAGPTPLRADNAENLMLGQRPAEPLFREAARVATKDLPQDSDIHDSAGYRRHASGVLARGALVEATARDNYTRIPQLEMQTKARRKPSAAKSMCLCLRGKLRSPVRSVEFSTIGERSAEYQKRL